MEYDKILSEILENMGRNPNEIAFKKYNISYGNIVSALLLSNNMFECSNILNLPEYSITGFIRRSLKKELPEKQGKGSWRVTLLYSIGCAQCPTCSTIFKISEHNKFKIAKGSYYCSDCINKRSVEYRKNNISSIRAYHKNYYNNNKPYFFEKSKRYRLDKESRVPLWANIDKLKEIYDNCPKGYHVDHIIPLHGKYVSGLHVENNLQYLLAKENIEKSNKFVID